MAINSTGKDAWCTTSDFRDEFDLEVNNQQPDGDRRIKQATRRVRARYRNATGQDPPDQPPDLLRDATAFLAASLAHQAFAQNIQSTNENDQRHIFLEESAWDTFEDWKNEAEVAAGDEGAGEASENVTGISGTISGEDPVHRGSH